VHVRLSPEMRDGACSLCNGQGRVLVFFVQVDDSHVAQTWDVCLPCLIRHHITVELEQLDTGPARRTPKTDKRASMRQEQKLADSIDGVRHRGSGSLPWAKGDVRKRGELRGEAKQTRARQYIIKRPELDKIRAEAAFCEDPFVAIWFCDRNWKPEDKWVLVPEEAWRRLHNGQ